MVKFSIIVPVYNCENYICECIESIMVQTFQDFEIILVNDGSTDKSGEICKNLSKKYPKIKSFEKKNGGASSARNYGLRYAAGRYILFIDGDDTIEQDSLLSFNEAINEYSPDLIVYGMHFDFYKNQKLIKSKILSRRYKGQKKVDFLYNNLYEFFCENTLSSACNKVFSADIIRNSNLYFDENLVLYEDLNFVINYLKESSLLYFVESGYYHYRIITTKNRYYSRINNFESVDNLMFQLHNSFSELESKYEKNNSTQILKIELDIISQIIFETLNINLLKIRMFKDSLVRINKINEFKRIVAECKNQKIVLPKTTAMCYEKKSLYLWCFLIYRRVRNRLLAFLKGLIKR